MNFITEWLSKLDDPKARGAMVNDAIGAATKKVFPGAVKSPSQGTTATPTTVKKSAPFLSYATERKQTAGALASAAGLTPPAAPEPTVTYPVGEVEQPAVTAVQPATDAASIFRQTLLSDEGGIALPPHMVDGIMMNAHDESGGDPAIYGDNGAAVGLLQWNGERQRALKAFADANGMAYNDPKLQGLFTKHELLTSERGAYEALQNTSTAGEAGAVFVDKFERPAEEHRLARRAKYLGGQGNADFVGSSGATLDYGPELSAVDPMGEEYVGRSADNYSMGMKTLDFETLREKYGTNEANRILNTTQGDVPQYDDAIMRFLAEAALETTKEEEQPSLLNGGADLSGAGLSMGTTVDGPTASAETGGGPTGGGGTAKAAVTASSSDEEDAGEKPKLTAVDRMMNAIYGTDVEDMTNDERADRRRAVGMALTQGFQMLSRGTPMDIQPIVQQRMELQQTRRAAEDLKKNAQGVSDMLVAAGMDELAQLPFMGENGMNAALNSLASVSQRAPADQPFDVSPTMRATMAQTLSDMGYEGPAQMVMNTEAGPAFEEVWNNAVGASTRAAPAGEGARTAPLTPEQRQKAAAIWLQGGGDATTAAMMAEGIMSDSDISKLGLEKGKVAPAVEQAGAIAAAEAGVEETVNDRTVAEYANMATLAGATPEEVAAIAAAPDVTTAADMHKMLIDRRTQAQETAIVANRGQALADMVPKNHPQAAKLKALALTVQTAEEATNFLRMLEPSDRVKTLQAMINDPLLMEAAIKEHIASSGVNPNVPPSASRVNSIIDAGVKTYSEAAPMRANTLRDMEMLRAAASDKNTDFGFVQGNVGVPLQNLVNSVFGENAFSIVDNGTVNAAKLMELSRNNNFAAASSLLSGAISNMESETFKSTFPTVTDSRTQILALAQYHINNNKIAQVEMEATLKWMDKVSGTAEAGDLNSLNSYVADEVKKSGVTVFPLVSGSSQDIAAEIASGKYKDGEVILIKDTDTGLQTYYAIGDYNDERQ
jgi:hypothetical protein